MRIDRSKLFCLAVAATLLSMTACGGNGGNLGGGNPPPTATLTASPASVNAGEASTLQWSSTNSTSCSGTGFTIPSGTTTSGQVQVSPAATTTYSVACSGAGGSTSASVTVTVTVPVTVTSVVVAADPASILTNQTSQCSATVNHSDGSTNSKVSWTATGGTITTAGVFTPSEVGTGTCIATSTEDSTKSSSASIVVTAPVTVTSVVVAADPASILTNQTSQCSATVNHSDGSTNSKVSWTATGGTITTAGVFTPSEVGTGTCIATSTEDSTKSSSASIVVTQAPPTIVAIDKPSVYCEGTGAQCYALFTLTTTGVLSTDTINVTGPASNNAMAAAYVNANKITVSIFFNSLSSGWYNFEILRGGNPSNVVATAFLPPLNTLAMSKTGELYELDQTKTSAGYVVYKFKQVGGTLTADGSFTLPLAYLPLSISYDDTTNTVNIQGGFLDTNGNLVGAMSGTGVETGLMLGMATKNGYGAITQPGNNDFFGYQLSGYPNATPLNLGSQPSSLAVGTIPASGNVSSHTAALVYSREDVNFWNVSLSDSTPEGSAPLTGITSISAVQAANPTAGGWQVVYAEEGAAAGTAAILSTPDSTIDLVNASTMKQTQQVSLGSGIWNQVAADNVHGTFVVASANPQTAMTQGSTTTFATVATNGAVMPLNSTSTLVASGLEISPDGNWIIICSNATCEIQPNQ